MIVDLSSIASKHGAPNHETIHRIVGEVLALMHDGNAIRFSFETPIPRQTGAGPQVVRPGETLEMFQR